MPIEIIRYDESRRSELLALQRHLWGRDAALNARILDWRYTDNPLAPRPLVYLLLVDGEVAGMRGFLPSRWRLGAGTETTVLLGACDLVLDPKHQAKGLVRHLMAAALEDLATLGHRLVLSFSASPATSLLSERQGWARVVDYDAIVLESRRAGRLRRVRKAFARLPQGDRIGSVLAHPLEGPGLGRLDRASEPTELAPGITMSDQPRLPAMAALMRDLPDDPERLRVAPSDQELGWRFRNPQRRYRFLYCDANGGLQGFLALSARPARSSDVTLIERRATSPEIEARLLDTLARRGGVSRLVTWSAGLSDHALDVTRKLGFTAFDASRGVPRYRPGFLVRTTDASADPASWQLFGRDVRDAASWELRPLASDAF